MNTKNTMKFLNQFFRTMYNSGKLDVRFIAKPFKDGSIGYTVANNANSSKHNPVAGSIYKALTEAHVGVKQFDDTQSKAIEVTVKALYTDYVTELIKSEFTAHSALLGVVLDVWPEYEILVSNAEDTYGAFLIKQDDEEIAYIKKPDSKAGQIQLREVFDDVLNDIIEEIKNGDVENDDLSEITGYLQVTF